MMDKFDTIDHIKTDSVLEALLLEAELIKKYQPEANILCVPKECPFTGLPPVEGLDDNWRKAAERIIQSRQPQPQAACAASGG